MGRGATATAFRRSEGLVGYAAGMRPFASLPRVALALAVGACSTSHGAGASPLEAGAGVGSPCSNANDCPPPTLCAWPVDGGCDAQGICVKEDLTCTHDGPSVCACDDSPVLLSCLYGAGRSPLPLPSPARACVGPDAGGD